VRWAGVLPPSPVFEVETQYLVLIMFVGTIPTQHGNTTTSEHHTTAALHFKRERENTDCPDRYC